MGFFGGSFWFTKGRIPEGTPWPVAEDTASSAGCKSQVVKVQDPGGTACDQDLWQMLEQQGGPSQAGLPYH